MGENGWKSHFSPPNRTFGVRGLKNTKETAGKSLFSRGAPPGCHLGHFWPFSRKGVKMGEITLKWVILPQFGVLGHFRDFRDSGLPEMQAPGGPASPIWEPPDFPR